MDELRNPQPHSLRKQPPATLYQFLRLFRGPSISSRGYSADPLSVPAAFPRTLSHFLRANRKGSGRADDGGPLLYPAQGPRPPEDAIAFDMTRQDVKERAG